VGDLLVAPPAGPEEDAVGAEPDGAVRAHGAVHPELPGLVGGRGDHPAPLRGPPHDDALALQPGIVELLHRGKEGIHVDV